MSREYVLKMISDLVSMDSENYAQCKAALLTQVNNKGFLNALFRITDMRRAVPDAMKGGVMV